ncbi:hypothetical protein PMI01_05281 [Caulobacter sp. AP07]|uniref:hypothetical protein n=1 Tax=Caulobacter sp. AP07 TaxID=1144304 RepID=UPI00027225D8|nr:hypothetical protein [Caulobacter sp. AP07]EJL21223.1 hypothetical protein PMI01_05281 [Caulobacter sp. AP07]
MAVTRSQKPFRAYYEARSSLASRLTLGLAAVVVVVGAGALMVLELRDGASPWTVVPATLGMGVFAWAAFIAGGNERLAEIGRLLANLPFLAGLFWTFHVLPPNTPGFVKIFLIAMTIWVVILTLRRLLQLFPSDRSR